MKIRTGGVFIYYQPFIGVITNTSIYNGAFWAHLSNYRFANGLPCLLKISFKQNQVMNWRGQAASPVYSKPDKPVFCCFKFCDKMGFVFFLRSSSMNLFFTSHNWKQVLFVEPPIFPGICLELFYDPTCKTHLGKGTRSTKRVGQVRSLFVAW